MSGAVLAVYATWDYDFVAGNDKPDREAYRTARCLTDASVELRKPGFALMACGALMLLLYGLRDARW